MPPGTISGLVARHGKKTNEVSDAESGTLVDKLVRLTPEGSAQMRELGGRVIKPNFYQLIDATTSPYVRTRQSMHAMLMGAGYEQHLAARAEREDLGFGIANWAAEGVPHYDPARGNDYVQEMLQKFWMGPQRADRQPVIAQFAYGVIDSFIQGVERVLPEVQRGANALVMVTTHGTVIDAADAQLYETIQPRLQGNPQLQTFPGNYAWGEVISLELDRVAQGLPWFKVNAKGRERTLSLDDLKDFRDKAYHNTLGHL